MSDAAARVYQVRMRIREQVMVCFPHMNFQFQQLYFTVVVFFVGPLLRKSLETIPWTMDLVEHLIAFGGIEI